MKSISPKNNWKKKNNVGQTFLQVVKNYYLKKNVKIYIGSPQKFIQI